MSDVRCRACGAAVPTEAQWCSLCFADLREPAPVREPVSVPAAPAEAIAAAPSSVARTDPDVLLGLPERPSHDVPEVVAPAAAAPAEAVEVKWPCSRCGEQVPLSLDTCPACGSGFLAGATTTASVRLPVVGDIQRLSRTQRLVFGLGISLIVMVVLVLLATIGGHFL
jgi:RNA polymerase subunit RPABC4/transcription elongation factor Spt4